MAPPLFISAVEGIEWLVSRSCCLILGNYPPEAGRTSECVNVKQISFSYQESNPDSSVVQPLAWSLYRLSREVANGGFIISPVRLALGRQVGFVGM
jgi:hypothetical protein